MATAVSDRIFGNRLLTGAFLTLSFSLLVYTSTFKHMGKNIWDMDTRCWYTAGTCWWKGVSPHDRDAYTKTWTGLFGSPPRQSATFVYPPTMALISLPLALLPWSAAAWTFRAVSMIAFLGICFVTGKLIAGDGEKYPLLGPSGWYAGLCALLGSVNQALFQGQCALVVVCACLIVWYAYQRKILWLFLLGFLFASIKPQVSMIPLAYILFLGGHRWFFYGAALSAAFSVLVLLAVPVQDLFGTYQGSMENHLKYQYFNQWDWYCGVPALLGGTPFGKAFMVLGVALGLAGAAWIARLQHRSGDGVLERIRHQQLVWIVAMAAMPVHIYDLTGQVFVVITLGAIPGWFRRAFVFVAMYLGDKAYRIADEVAKLPAPMAGYESFVRAQGTSIMALALLVCFCWWFWRDGLCTQSPPTADGPPA